MKKNFWSGGTLLLCLLLAGCSTTITNLTPSTAKLNTNGFYPFEVVLDVHQHAIRPKTLQPYVLVGSQAFPMQPAPKLNDRWETLVPISPDKEFVNYRFKLNYEYSAIPRAKKGSQLSVPYQLQIVEK
jgi:hypothetical protein